MKKTTGAIRKLDWRKRVEGIQPHIQRVKQFARKVLDGISKVFLAIRRTFPYIRKFLPHVPFLALGALYFKLTVDFMLWIHLESYVIIWAIIIWLSATGLYFTGVYDSIYCSFKGIRRVRTQVEKYALDEVLDVMNKISPNLVFYIHDVQEVEASAIGNRSIMFSKLSIDMFNRKEVCGIALHEIGHIKNGDNAVKFIFTALRFPLYSPLWVLKKIGDALDWAVVQHALQSKPGQPGGGLFTFFEIIGMIFRLAHWLFVVSESIILYPCMRVWETRADRFAYEHGYGAALVKSLYTFEQLYHDRPGRPLDFLRTVHPSYTKRIERLEKLLYEAKNTFTNIATL